MNDRIHILYISTLCSSKVWDFIFKSSDIKPTHAPQKFHSLLTTGLGSFTAQSKIEALSSIPVVYKSHNKRFWFIPNVSSEGIDFGYIPFVNLPHLRQFMLFAYSLFFVFFWGLLNKRNKPVVICDILNYSISWAALLACKVNKTRTTAIVTDLPGVLLNSNKNRTMATRIFSCYVKKCIHSFDNYVLLTEQMNAVVNPKNRPHIIMEGLVDKNMALATNSLETKPVEQIVHYAGGLYEMYGIKELIEGFMMLNSPHARLHLFGHGDMTAQIAAYCKKDSRITYFGVVPNEQVIADQIKATLLVNPRPSNLELAKFSFPSKNMEYMASGTPLLTTALPGMPAEYHEHVYIILQENAQGIYQSLKQLLSLPKEELHAKGAQAKEFVLEKKCNTVQAGRVIRLSSKHFE